MSRWYRVTFEETEIRETLVEAESAEQAREMVAEGEYDDSSLVEGVGRDICAVEDDGPVTEPACQHLACTFRGTAERGFRRCDDCGEVVESWGDVRPYLARCDLFGSTGDSPWSQIVRAESPERALTAAQSMADTVADRIGCARSRVTVHGESGAVLVEEQ